MPVNRKGLPREEREAAVLREAERHFLVQGFHATSVSDIAKSLGLTSNAVSWYYPTKDDLLAAVLRRWTRTAIATFQTDGPIESDVLAKVLESFYPYRRVYAVVHERMHHSTAVRAWHDESQELLTILATPMLEAACAEPARRDQLLPLLVELIEISLLHLQETGRTPSEVLDDLVASLVG